MHPRRRSPISKPRLDRRDEFLPMHLAGILGEISPTERQALRDIVAEADVFTVAGRVYLLAPISATTVDTLAAFDAEAAELEDDDQDEEDGEREPDTRRWPTVIVAGDGSTMIDG